MPASRALVSANMLIVLGVLVPVLVVGAAVPLADSHGRLYPYAIGILLLAPVCAVGGTGWSGWLAAHESRPRGFWSRMLFTLGVALCLAELFAVCFLPLAGV